MTVHLPVSSPPPSRSSTSTNVTVHCPSPTGEIPASNGGTPPEVKGGPAPCSLGRSRPTLPTRCARPSRPPAGRGGRGGVGMAPYPEVTALPPKWTPGEGRRP
jgi:hypothetical protein